MDSLVTIIGNAVADPDFCQRLLANPMDTLDEWGFHLSKGEMQMLDEILYGKEEAGEKKPTEKKQQREQRQQELAERFHALNETLYAMSCPTRRCSMSVFPPASQQKLRDNIKKAAA